MADTILSPKATRKPDPQPSGALSEVDSTDRLDWEEVIEKPPIHSAGTLRVKLVYAGHATPITFPDPEAE